MAALFVGNPPAMQVLAMLGVGGELGGDRPLRG